MLVENLGKACVVFCTRTSAAVVLLIGLVPQASAIPPIGGGTPVGGQFNATESPSGYQSRHQVAVDALGNSIVVWESNATGGGTAWTIQGRCFDAAGLPRATTFQVSAASSSAQRFPTVAMNATGGFVAAWEDFNGSTNDQGHRIVARRFAANCTAAENQFNVRTPSVGTDVIRAPAAAYTNGGDAWIFWSENNVVNGSRYSAFLTSPSSSITESQAGLHYSPSVAVDKAGNLAVAFAVKNLLSSDFDIYAQGFAAGGTALTGAGSTTAVVVNTTTAGTQDAPSVSMNAAGDAVIAWESDVSANEVQAQRFHLTNAGTQTFSPVGTEITVVAASTTHLQFAPSVAIDYAGNFWTGWQDVDASGPGITARWYQASGSIFGAAAVRVNAVTANAQVLPTVAADTDGDLLVAWTDQGVETSGQDDVFLRKYSGHENVDLSVTGSDTPSPAAAGVTLTYTLNVNNLHSVTQNVGVNDTSIGAATGISLVDTLPANVNYSGFSGTNWSCTNNSGSVLCTYAGTLLPQTSATLTINVVPTNAALGTTITNVATVAANQYDASTPNNTRTDPQSVVDQTPNSVSVIFTPVTNAALNTLYTSNVVTISGLSSGANAPLSISGGGQYSLNGANYTSANTVVNNGDTLSVQITTGSSYSTRYGASLQFGNPGASSNSFFGVTTRQPDTTPDAFAFTAVTNAAFNTDIASNTVTVNGVEVPVTVKVTGGTVSINGGPLVTTGTVSNGGTVVAHVTSSSSANTRVIASVVIGTVGSNFLVTTRTPDTTPDAFAFTAANNAALSSDIASNTVTIGGVEAQVAVSVTGGTVSINGGPLVTSGMVANGGTVVAHATSSANFNTRVIASVTVGTASRNFLVTTRQPDTTPDAFAFTAVTNAALNTDIASNTVTVGGVEVPVAVSVTGGTVSINGGPLVTSGTVSNGGTVVAHATSSANANTRVIASVVIGTVARNFLVTTGN